MNTGTVIFNRLTFKPNPVRVEVSNVRIVKTKQVGTYYDYIVTTLKSLGVISGPLTKKLICSFIGHREKLNLFS